MKLLQRVWSALTATRPIRLTVRGKRVTQEELFAYTNGRFLTNEERTRRQRYVRFDVEKLCAVASSAAGNLPVRRIEKMEGGFSKALLMQMADGSEVVAKIPCPVVGQPIYITAAEVAVMTYVSMHTAVPVPKVLAWSSDASNPVGAEYIIMEKAPGVQLCDKWNDMSEREQYYFIKRLCELEGELISIQLPANGGLYLRESMTPEDPFEQLDHAADPDRLFCIGPSCGRKWFDQDPAVRARLRSLNRPWTSVASLGTALADREIIRATMGISCSPQAIRTGTCEEKVAALEKMKALMSKLDCVGVIDPVSRPALCHTDLHLPNIYVSNDDPAQIVSIIDWQNIEVAPLFLQARFPRFLRPREGYKFGLDKPQLPEEYPNMDEGARKAAEDLFRKAKLTKVYELNTRLKSFPIYQAFCVPCFIQTLFSSCGDLFEDGIVALHHDLMEMSKQWGEAGIADDCPISFSEAEQTKHKSDFEAYCRFHHVQGLAEKLLQTDSEGWVSPYLSFADKQKQNKELLKSTMAKASDYGMSADEIAEVWPFK